MQTPESKNPCFCQVIFVLRKDAPLMPKKAWTGLKFSRKFEIIAMTGWPATARIESCRQEGKQLNTEPKPRLRRKMVNGKKWSRKHSDHQLRERDLLLPPEICKQSENMDW